MKLLIKGGTTIDPDQGLNQPKDVLVEDGKMLLVPVSIASILEDRVLIHAGAPHPGIDDKVIVSPLPFAEAGMAVLESPEL